MRRTLWLASFAVVVAAFAVALTAQSYGNPQSSSQSSSTYNSNSKITVTGCVQRSSELQTATGTSGTTGQTTAPDTQFVLTNATQGSGSSSSSMGTSGSSMSSSFASQYRLDDADQAKISPHVGHKVQITGKLENEGSSSSSSYGSSGTSGTSGSSSSSSNLPKLKVDSVKMISETCSE